MIKIENVHKYLLGSYILKGISLEIKTGETFVIVGPTGSGKSVLLRHLIGLHLPDEGTITVDGADIAKLHYRDLERMRLRFGVLFQSGALLNWMNLEDNIALPLREKTKLKAPEIEEKVSRVLEEVGLEYARKKMPSDISGGMCKRAALARAIITDPDIVLYDEPTSGLDPIMSRKIDSLIISLKEKSEGTSIVVTHDLYSAFGIADKIAMIYNGELVECGTPYEFRNSPSDFVQQFLAAQMGLHID